MQAIEPVHNWPSSRSFCFDPPVYGLSAYRSLNTSCWAKKKKTEIEKKSGAKSGKHQAYVHTFVSVCITLYHGQLRHQQRPVSSWFLCVLVSECASYRTQIKCVMAVCVYLPQVPEPLHRGVYHFFLFFYFNRDGVNWYHPPPQDRLDIYHPPPQDGLAMASSICNPWVRRFSFPKKSEREDRPLDRLYFFVFTFATTSA